MSDDQTADHAVDADEYARLLESLESFAQQVPHLAPAELVRRTQAFEDDLERFVPMHAEVVALLRRVARRAADGLDALPEDPGPAAAADDAAAGPPTGGAADGGPAAVEVQPLPRRRGRPEPPPADDDAPF